MKKLTAIIIALLIVSTLTATIAETETETAYYPLLTMVTGWEQVGDTDLYVITCLDLNGNTWELLEEGRTWKIGDICTLIMKDMSEEHEEMDEIVDVLKEGHLDEQGMKSWFRQAKW